MIEDLEQILTTSTLGDNALSPWPIRALAVETHKNWLEANRYLKMDYLRELKKEELRKAASSSEPRSRSTSTEVSDTPIMSIYPDSHSGGSCIRRSSSRTEMPSNSAALASVMALSAKARRHSRSKRLGFSPLMAKGS